MKGGSDWHNSPEILPQQAWRRRKGIIGANFTPPQAVVRASAMEAISAVDVQPRGPSKCGTTWIECQRAIEVKRRCPGMVRRERGCLDWTEGTTPSLR